VIGEKGMDKIEQKIIDIIEANAEKLIKFGDDIWRHAELGFEEYRTSEQFSSQLEELGLSCQRNLAITGVKSYLKDPVKEDEVRIALMGELDALPFANHEDANPETGAAHCCGHNAQLTGVLGAAMALCDPEIREALGGNVVFFAVPSEEASTEHKVKLRSEGKIKYLGGKCEFIRLGIMDDIDMTVGHHINIGLANDAHTISNSPSMGFVEKYITYTGIQQHPGMAHYGIDAQNAALLAMHAIDMQRESINRFRDGNRHILHGYILKGGTASNIISNHVELDYNMRSKTIKAVRDIAYRVDRALKGAAMATGAGLEIITEPGYLPVCPVKDASVIEDVFRLIDPEEKYEIVRPEPGQVSGTSDYGDLSSIMPVLQFMTGGNKGACHTIDFNVADPHEYYVTPAKCFALIAYRLLKDNAALAKKMIAENKPLLTKESYLELLESLSAREVVPMSPMPEELL